MTDSTGTAGSPPSSATASESGPGIRAALTTDLPSGGGALETEPELQKAWQGYQTAPTDEAAFGHLLRVAEEGAQRQVIATLEQRARERQVRQQHAKIRQVVVDEVNERIAAIAPELPRRMVWAYFPLAAAQTPVNLTDLAERIQWQTERALELARQDPALEYRRRQASLPPSPAPEPAGRFIDQMRALRRRSGGDQ